MISLFFQIFFILSYIFLTWIILVACIFFFAMLIFLIFALVACFQILTILISLIAQRPKYRYLKDWFLSFLSTSKEFSSPALRCRYLHCFSYKRWSIGLAFLILSLIGTCFTIRLSIIAINYITIPNIVLVDL